MFSLVLWDSLDRLYCNRIRRQPSGKRFSRSYRLTEASIALVPFADPHGRLEPASRHRPASKGLSVRAKILEDGGPKLRSEFMEELRHLHQRARATTHPSHQRRPRHMLTGLLRCGACGTGMSSKGVDKSKRIRIRSSAATESGTCADPKTFYWDTVETAVLKPRQHVEICQLPVDRAKWRL